MSVSPVSSAIPLAPQFLFTCCHPGSEKLLKKELSQTFPYLNFAFSRPGFLTFKNNHHKILLNDKFKFHSVVSYLNGFCLGKIPTAQMDQALKELKMDLTNHFQLKKTDTIYYHYWRRENFTKTLPLELPAITPPYGSWVIDILQVEENEFWLGYHLHQPEQQLFPTSGVTLPLPAEAPSRAYLKMTETLQWCELSLERGDQVLELGSSPGGISYELLQRGLSVVGVDTGEMDPVVLNHPNFLHLRKPAHKLTAHDLKKIKIEQEKFSWLVSDMNLTAEVVLSMVKQLMQKEEVSIRLGLILTLKLGHLDDILKVQHTKKLLKELGFPYVAFTQLPSHKQEIVAVALTKEGRARVSEGKKPYFFN